MEMKEKAARPIEVRETGTLAEYLMRPAEQETTQARGSAMQPRNSSLPFYFRPRGPNPLLALTAGWLSEA